MANAKWILKDRMIVSAIVNIQWKNQTCPHRLPAIEEGRFLLAIWLFFGKRKVVFAITGVELTNRTCPYGSILI